MVYLLLSAPVRLRVLSDLSQRVWCLPEHVAGWWPLRMLCGDRGAGCAPRVTSSRFSPGQSCFVLLACVEGLFCSEKSTVTDLKKGCLYYLRGETGAFETRAGVMRRGVSSRKNTEPACQNPGCINQAAFPPSSTVAEPAKPWVSKNVQETMGSWKLSKPEFTCEAAGVFVWLGLVSKPVRWGSGRGEASHLPLPGKGRSHAVPSCPPTPVMSGRWWLLGFPPALLVLLWVIRGS